MDDVELLSDYVNRGSDQAFGQIVRRYIDLVYTAARRQVGPARAEDVTQAVFVTLARKAKSLDPHVVLGGWLLLATRYAAANQNKTDGRRAKHEKEAAMARKETLHPQNHSDVEEVLDTAMAELAQPNRDAVVLRFLEGKSVRETAHRLGISEDAAKQRVSRAIEQLRGILARQGVTLSVAGLTSILATHAVQAAPAHLAAATASAATAQAATLAKGAAAIVAWMKANAAAMVVAMGILTGTTAAVVHELAREKTPVAAQAIPVAQAGPLIAGLIPDAQEMTLSAVVKTEEGQTIADAEVILATEKQPAYAYRDNPKCPSTQTDAQGRFNLKAPPGKSEIMVRCDQGYAQLPSEKLTGEIIVHPWGKLDGTVLHGKKRLAKQKVHFSWWGNAPRLIWHDVDVESDDQGHYVFPHLAQGQGYVCREIQHGRGIPDMVHFTYVEIEPGRTVTANLGGTGRDVIGHAETSDPQAKINWTNERGFSTTATIAWDDRTWMKRPANWASLSQEERTKLEQAWDKTPAGKLARQHAWGEQFQVEPDGSFRIEDVPPGKHVVTIRRLLTENGFGEDIAWVESKIAIPDGQSDEPLDLGGLTVVPVKRVVVGDIAPEVTGKTLDGKAINLSDYRGKYVLMHFWSPIYDMSMKDMDEIKAIHQEFGDRLTVLGWSMEEKPEVMKKTVDEKGIDWPCGFIGAWSKAPEELFRSPSHIFLIGPDGTVLAKNLGGFNRGTIQKAVRKFVK
jgi:RNA polymerase sigma factor (sigma-70 family)